MSPKHDKAKEVEPKRSDAPASNASKKAAEDSPPKPTGEPVALRVRTRGTLKDWCKAGFSFGPKPRDIPLAGLPLEKRAQLERDPLLLVELVYPS